LVKANKTDGAEPWPFAPAAKAALG